MPPLPLSTKMARVAVAALLAAVEICNKPSFKYREQAFAILMVNAWETFIKARVIQQNGEKINSIYRRDQQSKRYTRDYNKEPITIDLNDALSRISVPNDVKKNIEGIVAIRNRAMHLGMLQRDASSQVLSFGSASVQNFVKLYTQWFKHSINIPYLLPVGFVGDAVVATNNVPKGQQRLIKYLSSLANTSENGPDYAVTLRVDINLNPAFTGGGTIGPTNDPNAPRVTISDERLMEMYPMSYEDIRDGCKQRYSNFKANQHFNELMKKIKEDPDCAHQRKLHPNRNGTTTWLYNPTKVFERFDTEYSRAGQ